MHKMRTEKVYSLKINCASCCIELLSDSVDGLIELVVVICMHYSLNALSLSPRGTTVPGRNTTRKESSCIHDVGAVLPFSSTTLTNVIASSFYGVTLIVQEEDFVARSSTIIVA